MFASRFFGARYFKYWRASDTPGGMSANLSGSGALTGLIGVSASGFISAALNGVGQLAAQITAHIVPVNQDGWQNTSSSNSTWFATRANDQDWVVVAQTDGTWGAILASQVEWGGSDATAPTWRVRQGAAPQWSQAERNGDTWAIRQSSVSIWDKVQGMARRWF